MAKSYIDIFRKDELVATVEFTYGSDVYNGKFKVVSKQGGESVAKELRTHLSQKGNVYMPEFGGQVDDGQGMWGWIVVRTMAFVNARWSDADRLLPRSTPPPRLFRQPGELQKGAVE